MATLRTMQTHVLVLAVVLALGVDQARSGGYYDRDYANDYDRNLNFECPEGQLISKLFSVHSNYKEDRKWAIGCRAADYGTVSSTCQWTPDYVNDFDGAVDFLCPANQVIAGIHSIHSNYYEDRRMKFKCCNHAGFKVDSCEMTWSINALDRDMDYKVPEGKVMAGWVSEHFNKSNDRRHWLILCSYKQ